MIVEWIVIVLLVVTMYVIVYKYEKKMELLQHQIEENRKKIEKNQEKIIKNHSRLDEHYNWIENMWVTIPKNKKID